MWWTHANKIYSYIYDNGEGGSTLNWTMNFLNPHWGTLPLENINYDTILHTNDKIVIIPNTFKYALNSNKWINSKTRKL